MALMRIKLQLALAASLLATQVNVPQLAFGTDAAADQSPTSAEVYEVKMNTNTAEAIEIVAQTKPNFDAEVLVPLRAAQAESARQAAIAAAAAKARAAQAQKTAAKAVTVATGDVWERLRICEAGGSYTRNSGNGYYGAYQYSLSTWANYGGFARPDLAPPAVQDAKAKATFAARGWSPWPGCARKLGLM